MRRLFKIGFSTYLLLSANIALSSDLGRLFFTPQQRSQLDYDYARLARPEGDNKRALTLNGIVQKHGGKRTAWINGKPQEVGPSDEKSPESVAVTIPGQKKSVKLKVGQRVLLKPAANQNSAQPESSRHESAK